MKALGNLKDKLNKDIEILKISLEEEKHVLDELHAKF